MDRLKFGLKRLIKNMPETKKRSDQALKQHLKWFNLAQLPEDSSTALKMFETVEKIDMRKCMLRQILRHKNAKNSLDVNFLHEKITMLEEMSAKVVAFTQEKIIKPKVEAEDAGFEVLEGEEEENGLLKATN